MRLICLGIGYLCGCFQTSYILGRKKNIDIREHGSGNAGTTNALRVMGPRAGVETFLGDMGKMLLAFLLTWLIFKDKGRDFLLLLRLYTGAGVVLGHDFPFPLHFKGGKGVASTSGLFVLLDWRMGLLGLILFCGIVFVGHMVSLASIMLMICEFLLFWYLLELGVIAPGVMSRPEALAILGLLVLLCIWRHRANIRRLIQGTENQLRFKDLGK